ncbi:PilC/PilY family type IV pilus protein [Luteibacter sp. 22Crub2.1]|uniref:pilus assembly protein n=1 Tax=Luteibacter sp. 22Crub2.1 TaxID=1283288 RepID=UPI0009CC0BA6|nr:PilC/PilY family type IV pilus protein [Luteibacter sp. 22Crub2.1]SKB82805.1 type IV pilus assembly protein PilY1 [Luteibacter sp. 22Crub2.1]
MKSFSSGRHGLLLGLLVWVSAIGGASLVHADALSDATRQRAANYAIDPPLGVAGAAPLVMINLSRDHQLFYKAYNDFTDLDNDGTLDTTYKNALTYAGYFDSKKCYIYNTDGYFTPDTAVDKTTGYCTKQWSGNFLNWVSMTRMDEVRKILYGGLRSTDDTNKTILERAFLPADAHSFAKYYNGSDIAKLTPYDPITAAPMLKASSGSVFSSQSAVQGVYSVDVWGVVIKIGTAMDPRVGDQIRIETSDNQVLEAPVRAVTVNGTTASVTLHVEDGMIWSMASGSKVNMACAHGTRTASGKTYPTTDCTTSVNKLVSASTWTVSNLSRAGISFCNSSPVPSNIEVSQKSTALPLIRVAFGNYALWAANEKRQCRWSGEASSSDLQSGFVDGFRSNGNRSAYSGLGASAENATKSGDNTEFVARVQVCVSKDKLGSENCKQYPDALTASNAYKPVGLLQKYAETGNIKFGLVTPTFDHNASGGVVRAALPGPGTNDGDFISNEIDPKTGQFLTGTAASKGIISNINALRIYGYIYNIDNNYGAGYTSGDKTVTIPSNNCTFQYIGIGKAKDDTNRIVAEGSCSSWGNPMAESYIETLRYLAGKQPNSAFASGSEDKDLGMSVVATWNDPISAANFCAALNVINFNASSLSYDTDDVAGFSDLGSGKTAVQWTDAIGSAEGITGKPWFVGNSGTAGEAGADLCSAKTVTSFASLTGVCPEVPALKGGYLMAGAAYGAHVMPIRKLGKDASGNDVVPADDRTSLKVTTFGVQLATNTPQIRVTVPGTTKSVTIIPAYRLTYPSGGKTLIGGGALVDFKVISQTATATKATGTFYAVWEDSFAGGDYDQDMWGIISYEITATQVKITTKAVAASTNQGQGFGYIVSGTSQDGPHFHTGIYGFNYDDAQKPKIYDATGTTLLNGSGSVAAGGGCNNCQLSDQATMAVYPIGTTNAGTLSDPLLYASKWGGFRADPSKADGTDTPANDLNPLDTSKWDTAGKGTPDNYFLVSDPGKLEASLDALFRKILAKISSGTAAATVATSANGTGVTYTALYEAERTDSAGRRATWIGALSGLWTDQYGLLREDGNHNGMLDDYNTDPVITEQYLASGQRTVATRYTSLKKDTYEPGTGTQVELSDLNYLWNARATLWDPTLNTATQRKYSDPFGLTTGRYIFTWIDVNGDGVADASEIIPFTWDTSGKTGINTTNYRYLNSGDTTEAKNIVSWIRGTEISTMRNRTVDYGTTSDLTKRVTRLGDIINSTPLVVSEPAESYDLLYNDTTYASYRAAYRNRRQMVYVGANDGMLHAFNGGFYNTSCRAFTTQPNNKVCTATDRDLSGGTVTSRTAHPLGGEVWAYVPANLLPHLRWLTDPNYRHTYYVDGTPIAFDAKVFKGGDDDATHVGGWGTILVVPFRLGGGKIDVNTSTDSTKTTTKTFDSSFVVMDITDPEIPPTVLGELNFPGERALSTPAVAMIRDVTSGTPNKFFLAVGSGPTDPSRVASADNLTVKIYDVATLATSHSAVALKTFDLGSADDAGKKSFAGDLIASDFNLDGKAEGLYFGSVLDTGSDDFGGQLWKVTINGEQDPTKWSAGKMFDITGGTGNGYPITVRPTLGRNDRGAPMVFFGTGRMYTTRDKATSAQQRIYGVIDTTLLAAGDPQAKTKLGVSTLVDVTALNVYGDKAQTVDNVPKDGLIPKDTNNFKSLEAVFDDPKVAGWYRNLSTAPSSPSERVVSAQALLGGLLLTSTYVPGTSICTGLGTANLFGLNYKTGTADPAAFFGTTGGNQLASPSLPLGQGMPAPPSLHAGDTTNDRNGSKKVTACTQTSTGAIICKDVTTLNPVTSGETSWREPLGK